jgi:Ligase-CoA domain
VLTNGGGPGILVADACEAAGLLVPELSDDIQATLRAYLPPRVPPATVLHRCMCGSIGPGSATRPCRLPGSARLAGSVQGP